MKAGPGFWTQEVQPAPSLAMLARAADAAPWSFVLASGGKTGRRSRFTILAFDPFLVVRGASDAACGARIEWRANAEEALASPAVAEIARLAGGTPRAGAAPAAAIAINPPLVTAWSETLTDPLPLLRALLAAFPTPPSPAHPPFTGGLAGWFGYDLGRAFERVPERAPDPLALPSFALGYYDVVVVIDNLTRKAMAIATGYPERDAARRERRAAARLAQCAAALAVAREPERAPSAFLPAEVSLDTIRSNLTHDRYLEAVRRVKNLIRAGDIFQANVTQRLRWGAPDDPAAWFTELLDRHPVAFAAFARCERDASGAPYHIVSLSPERFLRVSGDYIETVPIKGTRPRSADRAADERAARDLLASPKDRAELVMIVDLLRNDLGRVAVSGSVSVPEIYALESYTTVHHLVARITARLRPGLGALDALRAAFPGGSISGAPKIRAMEILAEVEPHARGLFMGAIGYVGANGEMDTSIAIRTAVVADGVAHLQVGGGVVHDSRAEDEYQESLHKAAAFLGRVPREISDAPAKNAALRPA
ncbi:MAG: aminodeoxychorismate synthase component I [bacterium]